MTKEDKKLKKQSLQKNLDNARKEIEDIGKALKEQLERKALLEEKMSIAKRMHSIAMKDGGLVNLNPTWAFQKDPDYLVAQRDQSEWEFKYKMLTDSQTMLQIDGNIQTFEEQIESQRKNIAETEQKIKDLGE